MFPDDPELTSRYANLNPLEVNSIGLRCSDDADMELTHQITQWHGHYIEIMIHFKAANDHHPRFVLPGQQRSITYAFRLSLYQWGPHIERRLSRQTDVFSVELDFPVNTVDVQGYVLSGSTRYFLTPQVQCAELNGRDLWTWSKEAPAWEDRYRIGWTFKDGREKRIAQTFSERIKRDAARAGGGLWLDPENSSLIWNGQTYHLSPTQLYCMTQLNKAQLSGHTPLHQRNILPKNSQSQRLRDIFKNSPLLNTLLKSHRGGLYSLNIREAE